jgi:hypothetical protein
MNKHIIKIIPNKLKLIIIEKEIRRKNVL